jgi:hypothetical protein
VNPLIINFNEKIYDLKKERRAGALWCAIADVKQLFDGYSLRVIHKEGLCPSSGDINRLMMMKK